MIDLDTATEIAEKYLSERGKGSEVKVAIHRPSIAEESFGWVFCYNSEEYLSGGSLSSALAGNAPIVVKKDTGEIIVTGTAYPLEHYLAELRQRYT